MRNTIKYMITKDIMIHCIGQVSDLKMMMIDYSYNSNKKIVTASRYIFSFVNSNQLYY